MPNSKEAPTSAMSFKSIQQNVIGMVPGMGSNNTDLAVRIAVFTALAHCCLGLLFIAGFQVYIILETVVRPLMWALLTGTFLFPFKSFLADLVKGWLDSVEGSIVVAVAWTPISLVDRALDYVGAEIINFAREHGYKFAYAVAGLLTLFLMYTWMSPYSGFVPFLLTSCWTLTMSITASRLIWIAIVPYGIALHFFWDTEHQWTLVCAAVPLWIIIGFYCLHILGGLAVPLFLFIAVTLTLGYSAFRNRDKESEATDATQANGEIENEEPQFAGRHINGAVLANKLIHRIGGSSGTVGSLLHKSYKNVAGVLTDVSSTTVRTDWDKVDTDSVRQKLKDLGVGGDMGEGTRYLLYVFGMYFLLEALMSYYVIPMLLIPVIYRSVKSIVRYSEPGKRLNTVLAHPELEPVKIKVVNWCRARKAVIAPGIFYKILQTVRIGDRKVLAYIQSIADETVSAILIFLMFVFAATAAVVVVLQVEQETSYLISVTGTMFDDTVRNNPELYSWLPEADEFKEHIHSAYIYGRDFALKTITATINDENKTRVMEIEHDLTAIADRFYNNYIQKNATEIIPASDPNKVLGSLLGVGDPLDWLSSGENGTNPLSALWSSNEENKSRLSLEGMTGVFTSATKFLDVSGIQVFIREHIETVMSVFESSYSIVKDNVTLLSSLLMTLATMILTYFSAFLEFIICAFVYLTALFSLLSGSGKRYRPIEMISGASEYFSGAEAFAAIVEDTISGIFAVSLKMGTFYGFYTWVLMTFCGVYVRFIPSVLAAVFAVCPLVPTFAVCFPAAINMWLRGDYITLVILLVGAYLPTMFVDEAIYGDLKTANPYLFGIAVGGGLATMGIEGAVIGPMLLCLFTIVIESVKLIIQSRFHGTTIGTPLKL